MNTNPTIWKYWKTDDSEHSKKKVESAILLGVPIIKASVLDYDRVLPHHIWFN